MIQHRSSLFDLLFTSAHLELNAAIQDFSSRFGTVDIIVNSLISHCCIVTKMYYLHVFLSLLLLALSRGAFVCVCLCACVRLAAIDGDDGYTGVKPQHRYVTCPPRHRPSPSFRFFFIVIQIICAPNERESCITAV